MKSLLYVPGDSVKMIEKARATEADGIILDLEDSIAPEQKAAARIVVARILHEIDFGNKRVFVRINGLSSIHAIEDARAVATSGNAGILIPKIESPNEVTTIAPILASATLGGHLLLCLIETPLAVLACHQIAVSSPAVCGLVFGSADLVLEVGSQLSPGEPELAYARQHVLIAARAAGVEAFDSPHFTIPDLDGLRSACEASSRLGYDGKTAVHPSHVAVINEVFAPSDEEISEARRVVAALERASAEGRGAVALDGRVIDQVHLAHAKKVLSRVTN